MIKKVNPDRVMTPAFKLMLAKPSGRVALATATLQKADLIWFEAIVLSFVLTLFLHERGVGRSSNSTPPGKKAVRSRIVEGTQ
jgi:hypothetical protein